MKRMLLVVGWALATAWLSAQPPERGRPSDSGREQTIRVVHHASAYPAAAPGKPGRFRSGQPASLVLAAVGFNRSGGPLLFNHPSGLATDGRRLLVADRFNHRILIWNEAPKGNTPPDLVLGQPSFDSNDSGSGRQQLNWPGGVAVSPEGRWLAVADTNNDRVLLWPKFPTKSGEPAKISLHLPKLSTGGRQPLSWPWGVWTDGTRLAVVATHGRAVLLWNKLPTRDDQRPDVVLQPEAIGTPRTITSDGQSFFALSDHNYGQQSRPATLIWNRFPTAKDTQPDFVHGEWLKGCITPEKRLALAGMRSIYLWKSLPQSRAEETAATLEPAGYANGDGPDAVVVGGRLYVCNYNGNSVLAWNRWPTSDTAPPDFAIGSSSPSENTLYTHGFIQNPVVATDGQSLFASSDFDRTLHVWKKLPGQDGARPDLTFHLPEGALDNALFGQTLVLAGKDTVYAWRKLPLKGEQPDAVIRRRIGSFELRELTGVAVDDRYFYLADRQQNQIAVWKGLPTVDAEPAFTLKMDRPGHLHSDGEWLCAAPFEGQSISLWKVSELQANAEPQRVGGRGQFNLPRSALTAKGQFFVADCCFNRVQCWRKVQDALAGRPADAFLGANGAQDRQPGQSRDRMFMPGTLAYDGARLWVGEFKFSSRVLRFDPE